MFRKIISIFLLILCIYLLNGQPALLAREEVWEIPFLNCVTGPIASIGEYMSWSAKWAEKEINNSGGIAGRPVEVVIHDTGVKPDKGIEEMGKVVDNALVVMGPVPEAVIMASVPIAARSGLFCMTASTSYEYAEKYFPWTLSWYPPTKEKLPPVTEKWSVLHPDMNKVVQFVEKWAAWPGMAEAHEIGLKRSGVDVVEIEVPTDAITFGPLAVRALSRKPDGFILTVNAEKAAKIIRELVNLGWEDKDKILVFSSADDTALYTIGGDALEGISLYNYINPNSSNPRWVSFKRAYKEDHNGIEPGSLATVYYDVLYMIKEAIEETGITGDPARLKEERIKIRDYCRNVKGFEGVQQRWDMNEGVPTNKPVFIFEIKNGEKVLVGKSS